MRTKHFFMAMALPLAFAACTSEEFESAQNATDLSGRKVLGDVVLTFGDEAKTRMTAAGGAIGFVAGDGVGACLVDNYDPTGDPTKAAYQNYKLSEYIQTNYQYKYENGAWMTSARMVEGNYVFYAPYNGEHLARTAIKTGVPATQELTLGADGKVDAYSILDAFVKSGKPAYVGYKFLEAEGQDLKVAVDMKPIYAYPLVTFSNDDTSANASDITITKFVITGDNFPVEMPLEIGTKNAVAAKGDGVVGKLFNLSNDNTKNGAWATNQKNMVGNKTADVTGDATKTVSAITINVPGGALKVAKGETVKFHVVLPAKSYGDLELYAYYNVAGKAYKSNISSNLSTGKIYPDNQYSAAGTAIANPVPLRGKTSVAATDAPLLVNSTEELLALISSASDDLEGITATSDEVKITPDVVAAANPALTFKFASKMGINGDLNIANFTFDEGAVIESGIVTWNKPNEGEHANLTVKSGATLKLKAAVKSVTVMAGGKAEIGAGTGGDSTGDDFELPTLTNKGETTLKCDAEVNTINNYSEAEDDKYCGTINSEQTKIPTPIAGNWNCSGEVAVTAATTINAGATLTISNSLNLTTAGVTVSGKATLVVDEDAMLINGASNQVTIEENGLMEAKGLFKGAGVTAGNGRINLYTGYQTVAAFEAGSGILADVRESFDNTGTIPDVAIEQANMLSVKNLVLATGGFPKASVELQDKGTMTLNGNVTATAASTITTVGDATISGVFNLSSGADEGKNLTIVVAKEKTLTLKGISLVKGTNSAVTLKGESTATGTKKAKYKLTSGASVGAGVRVDESGESATIKKVVE